MKNFNELRNGLSEEAKQKSKNVANENIKKIILKKFIYMLIYIIVFSVLLFIGFSAICWQINNPKANQFTVYTYFYEVITFQTMDEFQ